MIHCPECDTVSVVKNGFRGENRRYKCKDCGNSFLDIHVKNNSETLGGTHEGFIPNSKAELTPEGEKIHDEIISPAIPDISDVLPGKIKKISSKPSHVWLRNHKHDALEEEGYSKKYHFYFASWGEYFSIRYKMKKEAKIAALELHAREASSDS